MPPPNALRARLALWMVASSPASSATLRERRGPWTSKPRPYRHIHANCGRECQSPPGHEESCPIEVHLEAVLPGLSCNHSKLLQREDLTPSDIVGILQAKELWTRKVNVIGADSGSQVLKAYNAPLAGNGP